MSVKIVSGELVLGPTGPPGPIGGLSPVGVVTANHTAQAGELTPVDASAGNVTITAPSSPQTGETFGITVLDSSTQPATLQGSGTDRIGSAFSAGSAAVKPGEMLTLSYQAAGAAQAFKDAVLAEAGLVSYWRLTETSGTTAHDSKGSNNGALPTYASTIKNVSGLLGFWRLNEGPGSTTVADSSTGGRTGTISGTPVLGQPGRVGSDTSILFAQSATPTQQILIGSASDNRILAGLNDWSIEAWVNCPGGGGLQDIYAELGPVGILQLDLVNNVPQLVYRDDEGATVRVDSGIPAINDGAWHHLVVTRSGEYFNVYIDGVLKGYQDPIHKQSNSSWGLTNNFTGNISAGIAANYNGIVGNIQEVAVYGRALSANEVAAHTQLGSQVGLGTRPGALMASGDALPALSLSGSSVTIPDSSSLHLTGAMTVEAWIRPVSVSGTQVIAAKRSGSAGFEFGLSGNSLYFTAGGSTVTGSPSVMANQWQHVVASLSGTSVSLYLNGVGDGSGTTGALSSSTVSLQLGSSNSVTNFFLGLIQEVAVYSAALSGGAVGTHYTDGSNLNLGVWYAQDGFDAGSLGQTYRKVHADHIVIGEYPYVQLPSETDDSGAFVRAITQCSVQGTGEIVVPERGTNYQISNTLKLREPLVLRGEGSGCGGPTLMWNGGPGSGPLIQAHDAFSVAIEQLNLDFSNILYDGNLVEFDHGLSFSDPINCRMWRCVLGEHSAGSIEHPHIYPPSASATGGTFTAGRYTWAVTTAIKNPPKGPYPVVGESSCPSPIQATIGNNASVTLAWTVAQYGDAYNVYRSSDDGVTYKQIAQVSHVTQAGPASWDIGTTYAVGNLAVRFNKQYVSLQNGNLAHPPETTLGVWWNEDVVTYTDTGASAISQNGPPKPVSLLLMNHTIISTVRECHFRTYVPYGIFLGGSYVNTTQIESCTFNACRASDIRILSADCETVTIRDCTFELGGVDGAIDGTNAGLYNFCLENNWFGDYGGGYAWLKNLSAIGGWGVGVIRNNQFAGWGTEPDHFCITALTGDWLIWGNLFLQADGKVFDTGLPNGTLLIGNSFNSSRPYGTGSKTDMTTFLRPGVTMLGNTTTSAGVTMGNVLRTVGFREAGFSSLDLGVGNLIQIGANGSNGGGLITGQTEALIYCDIGTDRNEARTLRLQSSAFGDVALMAETSGNVVKYVDVSPSGLGFYGGGPVAQPSFTYSRAVENAAQTQLRTALATLGLVKDNTTA